MSEPMTDYKHCEFRHLMTLVPERPPFPAHYAHVHEDEALACAMMVNDGWPDARVP